MLDSTDDKLTVALVKQNFIEITCLIFSFTFSFFLFSDLPGEGVVLSKVLQGVWD